MSEKKEPKVFSFDELFGNSGISFVEVTSEELVKMNKSVNKMKTIDEDGIETIHEEV